ncbi:hypothetical protein, partial [Vibrio parahaemolyticus]|uniref:hypothetical protein n=1 Tax=Vibrio parahaemolyticus TaxID=670 RepID=UPI001C5DFC72
MRGKQKKKPAHNKVPCPYCAKMVADLTQHVSQSHPESWNHFSVQNSIDLNGKTRCSSCGSFLKKIEGHEE